MPDSINYTLWIRIVCDNIQWHNYSSDNYMHFSVEVPAIAISI